MTPVVFLTLGYHANLGLAPKNDIFAIIYGDNDCKECGERITRETISSGALRLCREATAAVEQIILYVASHP